MSNEIPDLRRFIEEFVLPEILNWKRRESLDGPCGMRVIWKHPNREHFVPEYYIYKGDPGFVVKLENNPDKGREVLMKVLGILKDFRLEHCKKVGAKEFTIPFHALPNLEDCPKMEYTVKGHTISCNCSEQSLSCAGGTEVQWLFKVE